MGETNTSNGVSANSAKKKQEMAIQRDANIKENIAKFTGNPENTIYTNCTAFEVNEKNLDKNVESNTGSSDDSTATTANTTVQASNPLTQTLANVELSGVYVKVYGLEKDKNKGKDEKSDREDVDKEDRE